MNRATSRWIIALPLIGLAFILLALGLPAHAAPPPPETQATPLESALEEALQEKVAQHELGVLAFTLYRVSIERIVPSPQGDIALLWLALIDPQTGEPIPAEPGLAIARRSGGLGIQSSDWQITLQADADWPQALASIPDDLLDEDLRARYAAPPAELLQAQATVYRGYKLPWAGGLKKRLSGSIGHFLWYRSCTIDYCRYAYDFADGTMFPILAARGGTVYMAKWDCANGDETCSNYIVLKDVTTSPITYQLYLHLAQNSIPENLRQVGAVVRQGQYIGNADDTGYSTGHHLHFHVHTNPNGYWGTSVDIRFDDVSINDGTPRNCYEANRWPGYGTQCQDEYVSGNYGAFPPSGNLILPNPGEEITNGRILVGGTASDDIAVTRIQPIVRGLDGLWREVGPSFSTSPFLGEVDVCSIGLPNGPLDVAFYAWDFEGNRSPEPLGVRTVLNRSNCAPPPPPCTPGSNQVALFSQPDYQGTCTVLGVGDYSKADRFGSVGDNTVASIRVGSGVRALLYDLANFQGRSEALESDDPNLSDNPLGSGRLSSLKVQARSTLPATPTLLTPGYAADLDQPNSIFFTFAAEGATRYRVDVRRYADGQPVFSADNLRSPGVLLGTLPAASPATKYVWRVTAFNAAGSRYAEQSFEVFPTTAQNTQALNAPLLHTFDASDEGWQAGGGWRRLTPSGASSPSWVSGSATAGDLTSPPILIPTGGTYYLRFRYYADSESPYPYWDQRRLQISVDGGTFQDLRPWSQWWDDPPRTWLESPAISLAAYAGKTIRLRFHYNPVDGYYNTGLGWVVDDVRITSDPPPTCSENPGNDSLSSATVIAIGQSVQGLICPAGDVDFYRFNAQAGWRIAARLRAAAEGSPLDGYLALYDSNGNLLSENDDLINGQINDPALAYVLPYSGNYYLKVRAWNHPAAGGTNLTYTLQVLTDVQPPNVVLTYPTSAWLVGGTPTIRATASDEGSGVAMVNFFWRPDAQSPWVLKAQDGDGSDGWTWTTTSSALDGGDLYVEAVDFAGLRSGALRLNLRLDDQPPSVALQPLPSPNPSTAIPLRWTAQDARSGIAGVDLQWRQSADWLDLSSGLTPAQGTFWVLGAFGQSYTFRAQARDNAGNLSPWSGEVSTQVEAVCQGDAYESDDDTPQGAPPLLQEQPQEHTLCRAGSGVGDVDWLRFQATANRPLFFAITSLDGGAALTAEIYDASGSTLLDQHAAPALGSNLMFVWTPAQDGEYLLRLSPIDERLAGSAARYRVLFAEARFLYLPLVGR